MPRDEPAATAAGTRGGSLGAPLLFVLLLGSIWGLSFSLARLAILDGMTPAGVAVTQSAGAAALLLALGALRGERPRFGRRHLPYHLFVGGLGIALPTLVTNTAVVLLSAGLMATLINLVPLMTYGIAVAAGVERFAALRAAGVAVGFAGVLMILLPDASLPSPGAARWVLFALLAPVCFATTNVFSAKWRPADGGSLALATGMLIGSAALLVPVAAATGARPWPADAFGEGARALAALIVATALAYVLFFEIIRRAGPVFLSQTGYVTTVTGILFGKLFFGETHSNWIYAAAVLILAGMALVNARPGAART